VIVAVVKTFEVIHAFIFSQSIAWRRGGLGTVELVIVVMNARRFWIAGAVGTQRTRLVPWHTSIAPSEGAAIKALVVINANMNIVLFGGEGRRFGAVIPVIVVINARSFRIARAVGSQRTCLIPWHASVAPSESTAIKALVVIDTNTVVIHCRNSHRGFALMLVIFVQNTRRLSLFMSLGTAIGVFATGEDVLNAIGTSTEGAV